MSSAQIERMQEHLKHLRLHRIQSLLEASLEEAARNSLSYSDFLDQLLAQEIASKTEKNVAMRTAMARFPSSRPWRASTLTSSPLSTRRRSRNWPPAASLPIERTSSCWGLREWERPT